MLNEWRTCRPERPDPVQRNFFPKPVEFFNNIGVLAGGLLFLLASKALSLPLATSGKKLNVTDVLFFGYLTLR
jgi:hypothetical protein